MRLWLCSFQVGGAARSNAWSAPSALHRRERWDRGMTVASESPMQVIRLWLALVTLALPGCEATVVVDRFGRTGEPTAAPEALTQHEVSFMVRMHSPEHEILDAVRKRGLAEALDEPGALALAAVGAKPTLIEALRTSKEVLTDGELLLYRERKEKRETAGNAARQSQEEWHADYTATVNSQIASSEAAVRERRLQELTTEIRQLEKEKGRQDYSRSYYSPYQGVQRKIDKAEEERTSLRTRNR